MRKIRAYLFAFLLFASTRLWAVGWIPTDAGLVADLKKGDEIMLSVMIDGTEYFVCHYDGYTGGRFGYNNKGNFLKLIPQDPGATKPAETSVWQIDTALTRIKGGTNYALGGISYTMWSSTHYTLFTGNSSFKLEGNLSNDVKNNNLCDVVFCVPTVEALTNMDPNGTLNASHTAEGRNRGTGDKSWAFDGKTGTGFAGMTYREVYMFDIPRTNDPNAYNNAALVCFNTTTNAVTTNAGNSVPKGRTTYAYRDAKHSYTQRTIFRLYILNDPFVTAPKKYFFAWNEQNYLKYRQSNAMTDSTSARKIYTTDHWYPMARVEAKQYHQTQGMRIPKSDSTYYYVGYDNAYHTAADMGSGSPKAASLFTPIQTLRVRALKGKGTYIPPRDAFGYIAIDTTLSENNLGAAFEPAGYFLKVSSGKNVRLVPNSDRTIWTSEEMWYIDSERIDLQVKATLFTGPEFSETDPGADIQNWSQMVDGHLVPVAGHVGMTAEGQYGWPRIYADSAKTNGKMEFVLANTTRHIHYDNNGFLGADLPDQYPKEGATSVTVQRPRLKQGFAFREWNTQADGKGTSYAPGYVIADLPVGTTTLYAIAEFATTYDVALSFVHSDGKRYFLNHPGTAAPRFARARHYDDWTNVWQGMGSAENIDSEYVSTFKAIGKTSKPITCAECEPTEFVLDPKRDTLRGTEDSLVLYEYFSPEREEYLGLYYTDPNTILANNTWAGLFQSTVGWPDYKIPAIDSTKLFSTYYLTRDGEGKITRTVRGNSAQPYIQFKEGLNQFDGVGVETEGTTFQISNIVVADAHYVVLPDTTEEWNDEIVFDYHRDQTTRQPVWSKLIGKQLMACMMVGKDTTYFHPNRDKTYTTANELRMSLDFRLTQQMTYIRDARVEELGTVALADKPVMEPTENDFVSVLTGGENSPIDLYYEDRPIDIVDTIRVRLNEGNFSRIKAYYGRWKNGAAGLHVNGKSRYRDILVRTKTYHYGDAETRVEIIPQYKTYSFGPLQGQSKQIDFALIQVTYKTLYDTENTVIREDILAIDTITPQLALGPGSCTFSSAGASSTYFTLNEAATQHVTLTTKADNKDATDHDTLIVSTSVTIAGKSYPATVRVPLMQSSLTNQELIWSVVDGGERYFIMAGSEGLIYRQFTRRSATLYQLSTNTKLVKGTANAANSDPKYITPWKYTLLAGQPKLTLTTELPDADDVNFVIKSGTPDVDTEYSSEFTYRYAGINTNDNANYEELVRIKYGADQWMKFTAPNTLTLQEDSASATVFSWSYLSQEYNLYNKGAYPSLDMAVFDYNSSASAVSIQTRYKAYREYSMLLDNTITYVCREDEENISNLTNGSGDWKTNYAIDLVRDSRFAAGTSGLSEPSVNTTTLTTKITPSPVSPTDIRYPAGTGPYVDIVDTLRVTLSLQDGAPEYRFKGDWTSFTSIRDAQVKIPLVRKTFHEATFDSLVCQVEDDEYNYTFPSSIAALDDSTHTFSFATKRRRGTHVLDIANNAVSSTARDTNITGDMHLNNAALAEVRLVDEYGNTPSWCKINALGSHTVTVKCTENGIRSPRTAYLYLAYIVEVNSQKRYVNFRLTVSQPSLFQYANNQVLVHTKGASGDELVDGKQQVHEHKRILYYYNPAPYNEPDQDVELPIRERAFYGWWRWYREGKDQRDVDVSDTDIPDSVWIAAPRNVGRYDYPYRIIGDSVYTIEGKDTTERKLVTMGRYTVFHFPAVQYGGKADPPAKSPMVAPPHNKTRATYAVDISNYYDNLPLSMSHTNQIDTAVLDTMQKIIEPTLSLREVFELRPWTEMAETLEDYKSDYGTKSGNDRYLEDHVVMAPLGNKLLLQTEQRYNYDNLSKTGHSESLLGYYMRDDNWDSWEGNTARQDTMIWCAGWDAMCMWFIYNPKDSTYGPCNYRVTAGDDFLEVPAKSSMPAGQDFDTVYYCLRSRSMSTTLAGEPAKDLTVPGNYWFNICRYKVIYHRTSLYGPMQETSGKALITNDEIDQHYEVLERLNFDYNKPGSNYQVYPHPLPWTDASYGYSYPVSLGVPDNRYHNDFAPNFPGTGEYGLINRIPYSKYWHQMEQHGGAENGYMIYCDGMSSAGQVAALSLNTKLCEGQHMFFSAYVGNPGNQTGKSNPNFTFSVQGSVNGRDWNDITSYMTGEIQPSDQWSQIFFPIEYEKNVDYQHFRVRIYNVAADFDGNDFIIDDMCLFATKPQLISYQANTTCAENGENDSITHVILRVDYQGFSDPEFNDTIMFYTIEQKTREGVESFVTPMDHYLNQDTKPGASSKPDTVYGVIRMPGHTYEPLSPDSIFANVSDLIHRFERTEHKDSTLFRQGYIYEEVDNIIRPVMYVVHKAKLVPVDTFTVRMAIAFGELDNSICAMTSGLKVNSRMLIALNDEEYADKVINNLCPNSTYDLSLRVKGSLFLDSVAPISLNGTCVSDWLLYGDTADASSETRYGYKYSDIVKVVKGILRCEPGTTHNANQFAANLSAVSKAELDRIKGIQGVTLSDGVDAYTLLSTLVSKGFLTLYRQEMTAMLPSEDSVQYVIFPIIGTGRDDTYNTPMEVCPKPIYVKLKPGEGGELPMIIGGMYRNSAQAKQPLVVLSDEMLANDAVTLHLDSLSINVVLDSIYLLTTNDPDFHAGVHSLRLVPDRTYDFTSGSDNSGYYKNGDDLILRPENANTYRMRPGYRYNFIITFQTPAQEKVRDGCRIGSVPFTVSVVPHLLRWNPQTEESNQWNNPDNWIGITSSNQPIHADAHFAPLPSTKVLIPAMTNGMPYPELMDTTAIPSADSVKQVGFRYNTCEAIRFMPGTALGQQRWLNYTKAIVDMELPHDKWAFRSAPVKGMISGDIFLSNADINAGNTPWEVGAFDATGRNKETGNASFWLSMYSISSIHRGNGGDVKSDTVAADADWSRVTNGMTLSLPPAKGFAVFTRTKSGKDAAVRLPKNDDIYYYFDNEGKKLLDIYEHNLQSIRTANAGGSGAGELAFHPAGTSQSYTITQEAKSNLFVLGNPTMAYIDIWGFIADNGLNEEIDYMDESGKSSKYTTVSKSAAVATTNEITNRQRYLPPMGAIVVKTTPATSLTVTLNTNRVVTSPVVPPPSPSPRRSISSVRGKGIMTITAINPASSRCTSRLLLGQGYHDALREGEDAILTTVNINRYTATAAPATPFNIYAVEGNYGLSIDLRDSLVNVPISFYMGELPFEPVTHLWFTGVNAIDGALVLYDIITDSERDIIDGCCLDIETPDISHEIRYYIRRKGFKPGSGSDIATDLPLFDTDGENAVKIIKNGHVLIIRNGHVYSIFGQKIR